MDLLMLFNLEMLLWTTLAVDWFFLQVILAVHRICNNCIRTPWQSVTNTLNQNGL